MTKTSKSDRTRTAILDAARQLFAERGFDATTVRDIADLAGIDPALVIRYFGSKDLLFVRAADLELEIPPLDRVPEEAIGEALVRHFIDVWEGPSSGIAVLLRSAGSNEHSAARMREIFATQVRIALAAVGERATAAERAALVASQLLGLALCRYVLRLPPLVAMSVDEVVAHVAPVIQRYAIGTGRRARR